MSSRRVSMAPLLDARDTGAPQKRKRQRVKKAYVALVA